MRIHQLLAAAAPGDAVTTTALMHQRLLRRLGSSEVYATYVDPALSGRVHPLTPAALPSAGTDDVLLVHVSIGAPELLSVLEGRPERVGLVYHNLSPAPSFAPFDPGLAELLVLGRRELPVLVERCDFALACSRFNASELEALGLRRIEVVPPFTDLDALLAAGREGAAYQEHGELAAPGWRKPARPATEGPLVLQVAQVAPHKRQHSLVNAFHVLCTYLAPGAGLVLVGPTHTPRYARAVRRHIDRLSLLGATMTGRVGLGDLAAAYRRADVFVTLSEHEGFCVPLLEAMAFGVPVVAARAAAIPETAGDAALLLDETAPELVAEGVLAVVEDGRLRDQLLARGRVRVEQYRQDAAPHRYLDALGRFL